MLVLWDAGVVTSGNRPHFVFSTLPVLLVLCLLVSWRVYVTSSRTLQVRLYQAVIDGALIGVVLAMVQIAMLFGNYAMASEVWWDGSDGSDPSDWYLWLFQFSQMAFLLAIIRALGGCFLWLFNLLLSRFVFDRPGR